MNRPIWQRIGAIVCCLLFICCFGVRITAEAVLTELAIGGVVVASVALLAGVAVIGLGASGYSDQMRTAANNAGQSVNEWMQGRISAYNTAKNSVPGAIQNTPLGLATSLLRSLTYNSDGTLIFSRELSDFISDFGSYLIDNGDIAASSTGEGIPNYNADGLNINQYACTNTVTDTRFGEVWYISEEPIASNANYDYYISQHIHDVNNNVVFALTLYNGVPYIANFDSSSYYPRIITTDKSGNFVTTSGDFSTGYTFAGSIPTRSGFPAYADYTIPVSTTNPAGVDCRDLTFSSTGATDGLDVWNDDTATDGFALDPVGLLGDAVNDLSGSIANIGDYISALADVIAGVQAPALPVVGVGDIPLNPVIPADISIPITPAIPADIADSEPVTGEDAEEPYTGTGDYTLPLADFFPFCIPFDIYKMLSLLAAEPVAPSLDYPFPLPGGGTYTIHLDLSQFNTAAQVLRTIETLAFCVGLGFATKKLLFGS